MIESDLKKERSYTVYKHTSPSGKCYIGITGQNPPEKRWQNGRGYKHNKYFSSAISKYGWDNFSHEILLSNLTKKEAEESEIKLIAKYKSSDRNFGYNLDFGGSGAGKMSDETKKKLSESHKKIDNYWNRIPICRYTRYGDFIKKWESSFHASSELNIEFITIRSSCRGEAKLVGGYIWKNYGDTLTEDEIAWRNSSDRRAPIKKAVCQYNKDGYLIKKYDSITDASKETGLERACIGRCCDGTQRISGGYIWRYFNEELTIEHLNWCNKTSRRPTIRRPVIQYSKDGVFINKYKSITIASLETGVLRSNISACCNEKHNQKTAGGYIWKYDLETEKEQTNKVMGEINE